MPRINELPKNFKKNHQGPRKEHQYLCHATVRQNENLIHLPIQSHIKNTKTLLLSKSKQLTKLMLQNIIYARNNADVNKKKSL